MQDDACLQDDSHAYYAHILIFEIGLAAYAAYTRTIRLGVSCVEWDVQAGGKRMVRVLDEPPPCDTWSFWFVTRGLLSSEQVHQILEATGADEGQWNQVCEEVVDR